MPQPYLSQVHVDVPLTNMSVAYIQSADAFIAPKVFSYVPSDKQSNRYFKYTKDDWFRDDAKPRGVATESAGGGYNIDSTPSFSCVVYAFHKDVDEQIGANADAPLNMDRDAALFTARKLLLRQEIAWVSSFFTTGIWTGSSSGSDITPSILWNDPVSTPIEDVQVQARAILTNTGFEPNTFVLGFAVAQALVRHPDVIDLIKYGAGPGSPAVANEAALAKIFSVERVLVSKSVKNTAAEGASFAGALTAGKNALLCYVNPEPSLLNPTAGSTFVWTGISRGIGASIASYMIPMPWLGLSTKRVESEIAFDHKVVGADLGAFFSACVA